LRKLTSKAFLAEAIGTATVVDGRHWVMSPRQRGQLDIEMGTTKKTLSRIIAFVDEKHLPLGARIAELGTQNLWCAADAAVQFLRFFQERGARVSMTEAEAMSVANGGYRGALLSGDPCRQHQQCGRFRSRLDVRRKQSRRFSCPAGRSKNAFGAHAV
jgi:hypothetical protein